MEHYSNIAVRKISGQIKRDEIIDQLLDFLRIGRRDVYWTWYTKNLKPVMEEYREKLLSQDKETLEKVPDHILQDLHEKLETAEPDPPPPAHRKIDAKFG